MKLARAATAVTALGVLLATTQAAAARIPDGGSDARTERSLVMPVQNPLDLAGKLFAKATKKIRIEDPHELRWPVPDRTVNTPFTGEHAGIDIEGETGDAIVAAASGVVVFAGDDGDGYGRKVIIRHDGKLSTLYSHLNDIDVSKGQITRGQKVGTIGCTGSCSGDHLHFEVLVNGTPVNPMEYLKR